LIRLVTGYTGFYLFAMRMFGDPEGVRMKRVKADGQKDPCW
jgi:hypothetical protein